MKIGIMQPCFFPYIGYFQLINSVDKYVIYDDVQFIKGGWINRNNILLNGERHRINLLLSGASSNKSINEVEVQSNQVKLIKTIESAYKKAPTFDKVFPVLLNILEYGGKNLGEFLGNSIKEFCNYMDYAITKRKEIAQRYREALRNIEGITVFEDFENVKHNYPYFPILVDADKYGFTRDELYEMMKANYIFGRRYFYPLISQFSTYRGLPSASATNLLVAEEIAEQVICLPISPKLDDKLIRQIATIICKI